MRHLRTCLMIGASAITAATLGQTARADSAPPAKWLPNVSVSAQGGDDLSGAKITGFDPIWQDLNSLVYARLGFGTLTHDDLIANVGMGYRTEQSTGWITGVYGGFDFTRTRDSHSFSQASVGAEAMNADWDFRANGYFTVGKEATDLQGSNGLFLQGTRIALLQGQLAAYTGVDGEIGYRVFNTDDIDVRLFAGGFTFGTGGKGRNTLARSLNVGASSISGPVGRAEIELYNLHEFGIDLFGPQSRLTISGQVSHDDVRGTQGFAGISLQIALGDQGSDEDQDELDRRMVDPVRRQDQVLVEKTFANPEPVILSNGHITSAPTNTIYYVDNTVGAGTYADPTTLHDATQRGQPGLNQFVVVTDRSGPTLDATGTTVKSGETITGPGVFTVTGAVSGRSVTHDFAPHSGPVTLAATTPNAIVVQSNTNLYGITITGSFTNAIYGHNVTGVHLSGITIDGGGVGQNGVYFHDDDGTSTNVTVDNSIITGVTQDGIKLTLDNATGTTAAATANLTNLNVTAGQFGVTETASASGGSNETTYLGVHNSTLTGGTTGLSTTGSSAVGSSLTELVTVDPTHISGGYFGFLFNATSYGGTLDQSIALDQVYVSGTRFGGIVIGAEAENNGTVLQNVTMSKVTTSGGDYGIELSVGASSGHATQSALMSQVTASGALYDNIRLGASANTGGTAHQYTTLQNSTLSGAHYYNLFATTYANTSGVTQQNLTLNTVTATGALGDNIRLSASTYGGTANQLDTLTSVTANGSVHGAGLEAHAGGTSGSVLQQLVFTNLTASGNGNSDGIDIVATTSGAAVTQQLTINGAVLENNEAGLYMTAFGLYAGTVSQAAHIDQLTANYNIFSGMQIASEARGYGFGPTAHPGYATQTVVATNSTFSHNGVYGVEVLTEALSGSSEAKSNVYMTASHVDANGGIGVLVNADNAGSGTHVYQYFSFEGVAGNQASVNGNGNDGLRIIASAVDAATVQYVALTQTTVSGNHADGVFVHAAVYSALSPSTVYQYVYLDQAYVAHSTGFGVHATEQAQGSQGLAGQFIYIGNSTITENHAGGIKASQHEYTGALGAEIVYVVGDNITNNHGAGVWMSATSESLSTGVQALVFGSRGAAPSTITGNTYGIYVWQTASSGSTTNQFDIVYGVDLSHNEAFGFDAKVAYTDASSTGRQTNEINDSTINYNHDGVELYSFGPGANQASYLGSNEIAHNTVFGVYGVAAIGSYQYIGVYTFGNNVHNNGTNYLFNSSGGSTQVVH